MKHWYLIHSKPRQERIAQENLVRQGYTVYLPMIHEKLRRNARIIKRIAPLFPRYIFINLDNQTDNWKPISSTLGVSRLVTFGFEPARIPENIINQIRAREAADGIHPLAGHEFKSGEKVRVIDGAFAGVDAIFSAKTAKERVLLLLEIAGRTVPVEMREADLETVV